LTGSPPIEKTTGNARSQRFGGHRGGNALDCHDHLCPVTDQFGGQRGQPLEMPLREAVLHVCGLALGVADFIEALPDRIDQAGLAVGPAEQADHGHGSLRAGDTRPEHRRAPEDCHELASSHADSGRSRRAGWNNTDRSRRRRPGLTSVELSHGAPAHQLGETSFASIGS
jgi:hypothetical protein